MNRSLVVTRGVFMPDAIDLRKFLGTPLTAHRLRDTPLRDLLRGRVTGRLAWRDRLARAALPVPIADAIGRIVRRTRLWRIERATIADELIAHFVDGLAIGASADELVRAFGDVDVAARLIRRAALRKRPLAWHALKWTRRLLAVLLLLYALAFARFLLGRPTVTVDYLAQVNAPALAVAEADRAWPLYCDAMRTLEPVGETLWTQLNEAETKADRTVRDRYLIDVRPGEPEWPRVEALLDANVVAITQVRAAAARPALGFVFGRDNWTNDTYDNDLGPYADPLFAGSLLTVRYPFEIRLNTLLHIMWADARLAVARDDHDLAAADLAAMLGIAGHLRGPLLGQRDASIDAFGTALDAAAEVLRRSPDALNDAQWIELAHRIVATIGGDTAASLINLDGERARFKDLVQRLYTDDGHGDGQLTPAAGDPRTQAVLRSTVRASPESAVDHAGRLLGTSAFALVSSRRAVLAESDRLAAEESALLARALRETNGPNGRSPARQFDATYESSLPFARYAPGMVALRFNERNADVAERRLGQRDGVLVGIALELFRRQRGTYPAMLDELVPTWVPRVPVDRFTGGPVRYRLIDGRPIVYSVGADGKDDGGRPSVNWRARGKPPAADAAAERSFSHAYPASNGDWLIYHARADAVPRTPF